MAELQKLTTELFWKPGLQEQACSFHFPAPEIAEGLSSHTSFLEKFITAHQ